MNGHERDAGGRVCQILILVGQEAHFAQEIRNGCEIDAFVRAVGDKLLNGIEQLLHVLRTVDSFSTAVERQGGENTRLFERLFGKRVGIHRLALFA